MADNIEKTHESLINDSLAKNAARILSIQQVIEQYENQIKLFKELPNTLKKSVLVPIGTKGFLRGQIVHTNEVFHKVGCGYVIKRTAKQAIDYCDRMLVETNSFLTKLQQEESWLTNQLNITSKENPFATKDCVEIVENYDEATEVEWRKKHRESLKKWKQDEAKEREILQRETSDKDCFSRLDELEILEELEQFTSDMKKFNFEQERNASTESISIPEVVRKDKELEVNAKCIDITQSVIGKESEESESTCCNSKDGCIKAKEENESVGNIGVQETENVKKLEESECKKSIEKINENTSTENIEVVSPENIGNGNTKKYLDFVELHKIELNKLNEKLENLHNKKSTNDENKNNVDINTRKLQIEEELEKTRKSKTIIKTDEDLMKRLDELEKEEELLEEMEILTSTEETVNNASEPSVATVDDDSKKCTIRFNEQVRTNFYVSTKAVSDELEIELIKNQGDTKIETATSADDDPVTLYLYFSHTQDDLIEKSPECNAETVSELGLLKPSDIYDLPYRPKSILKNKNKLFEEPQHTGEHIPEPITYSHHRKKDRGRDRWVCHDTFSSKNGNDSDQENANVVQVPPPLTEVKEKSDFNNSSVASTTTVGTPPKKRQSRFLVSRALITKK